MELVNSRSRWSAESQVKPRSGRNTPVSMLRTFPACFLQAAPAIPPLYCKPQRAGNCS